MNKPRTWRQFLGHEELRTKPFFKALFSEFLGTAILMVSGCGSVVTTNPPNGATTVEAAATFSMTVAMIIWTLNHVSGAHINPSVSISFMVTGHISLTKTLAYIVVQCAGSICGSYFVWCMVPPSWRGTIGSTVFHENVTLAQGFAIEMMATFFLLLAVFASSDRLRTDHGGSMPLTVGLVVFMQSAWAGKPTGCSMNPARTLGPALVSGTWDHHWVYWLAPTVGGIIGAMCYQHVFAQSPPEIPLAIQREEDLKITLEKGEKPSRFREILTEDQKPVHFGETNVDIVPDEHNFVFFVDQDRNNVTDGRKSVDFKDSPTDMVLENRKGVHFRDPYLEGVEEKRVRELGEDERVDEENQTSDNTSSSQRKTNITEDEHQGHENVAFDGTDSA